MNDNKTINCPFPNRPGIYAGACDRCLLKGNKFPSDLTNIIGLTYAVGKHPDSLGPPNYKVAFSISQYCPNIQHNDRFLHIKLFMGSGFEKNLKWIDRFFKSRAFELMGPIDETYTKIPSITCLPDIENMHEDDREYWRETINDLKR